MWWDWGWEVWVILGLWEYLLNSKKIFVVLKNLLPPYLAPHKWSDLHFKMTFALFKFGSYSIYSLSLKKTRLHPYPQLKSFEQYGSSQVIQFIFCKSTNFIEIDKKSPNHINPSLLIPTSPHLQALKNVWLLTSAPLGLKKSRLLIPTLLTSF